MTKFVQSIVKSKAFVQDHRGPLFVLVAFSLYIASGPARLYLQNRFYFGVDFGPVAILSCVILLAFTSVLVAIYALTPQRMRKWLERGTIALLVGLFAYSELLFFLIPQLDGATRAVPVPWYFGIDAIIVVIVLVIFTVLGSDLTRARISSLCATFLPAFVVLQVIFAFAMSAGEDDSLSYRVPARFPLSADSNVIHLVLDTLQSTEFVREVETLGFLDEFEGFTAFVDSLGVARSTELSLPSVFSGKYYDKDSIVSYYAGKDKTILDSLSNYGFDINAISVLPLIVPENTSVWKDWQIAIDDHDPGAELGELIDLYLIRTLPFAFKDVFLNNYDWFFAKVAMEETDRPHGTAQRASLLSNYTAKLVNGRSSAVPPTYYFVHILSPHPPYTQLPDCSYSGKTLARTTEIYATQVRCVLVVVKNLLDRLKDLGVYDNTVIVLQGDTGSYDSEKIESLEFISNSGMAFPALAVKPLGAAGSMKISNKPAALIDVPNVLLGSLDKESQFDGYNLIADEVPTGRLRRFEDFVVTGSAFDPSSWSRAPKSQTMAAQSERNAATSELAFPLLRSMDTILFGPVGVGRVFLDGEWGRPTRAFRPTGTPARLSHSRLKFELDDRTGPPVQALVFEVSFPGGVPTNVSYDVNGEVKAKIDFAKGERGSFEFRIPVVQVSDRSKVVIEFLFEEASPHPNLPNDTGFVLHRMFAADR